MAQYCAIPTGLVNVKSEIPSNQIAATTSDNAGELALSEVATAPDHDESMLDPLEQISDVFRDLDEFRVHKGDKENNVQRAAKLSELMVPGPATTVETYELQPRIMQPVRPRESFWKRVVSLPEMLFSIGFSLLIIMVTAIFYSR